MTPLHPSWLAPRETVAAHNAAIDRLCMNLLTGAPSLDGVAEEYRDTLAIERELTTQTPSYRTALES